MKKAIPFLCIALLASSFQTLAASSVDPQSLLYMLWTYNYPQPNSMLKPSMLCMVKGGLDPLQTAVPYAYIVQTGTLCAQNSGKFSITSSTNSNYTSVATACKTPGSGFGEVSCLYKSQ